MAAESAGRGRWWPMPRIGSASSTSARRSPAALVVALVCTLASRRMGRASPLAVGPDARAIGAERSFDPPLNEWLRSSLQVSVVSRYPARACRPGWPEGNKRERSERPYGDARKAQSPPGAGQGGPGLHGKECFPPREFCMEVDRGDG